MRWQTETALEHARGMVFGQGAERRQLAQRQRCFQMRLDEVAYAPALHWSQTALQAQALTLANLVEQGMVEQLVGQAAGQQAFARFLPVEGAQLAKTRRLLGIFKEGCFLQLQTARFTVEQGDRTERELLLLDIEVGELNLTVDDPGRLVLGRQDAQLVRRALVAGLLAAKGAGASGQVAGQRVMTGGQVVACVVGIAPAGCSHAVAQLGHRMQPGVGRAAHALKYLQTFELRHQLLLIQPCYACRPAKPVVAKKMRKFAQVWGPNL